MRIYRSYNLDSDVVIDQDSGYQLACLYTALAFITFVVSESPLSPFFIWAKLKTLRWFQKEFSKISPEYGSNKKSVFGEDKVKIIALIFLIKSKVFYLSTD